MVTIKRVIILIVAFAATLGMSCVRMDNTMVDVSDAVPDLDLVGAWQCIESVDDMEQYSLWFFIGRASRNATPWRIVESARPAHYVSKGCMNCEVISFRPKGRLDHTSCQFIPVRVDGATYVNIPVFSAEGKFDHAILLKYEIDDEKRLLRIWLAIDGTALRSLIKSGELRQLNRNSISDPIILTDVRKQLAEYLAGPSGKRLFPVDPTLILQKMRPLPRSRINDKGQRAAVRMHEEAPGAREKSRMSEGSSPSPICEEKPKP